MATIGKLAVQITADTAGLASGLATAGRQTDDFQARLGGLTSKLKILGPAAIAAGGAFAIGMVKSIANTADELSKLSARTGVAVEDLSRLQYAADMSGVSSETLTASIDRLSRGMSEAATGTGATAEAFRAMGVSVKNQDGTLRSQREVIEDIADRFAGYSDGAEKSALAMQIFGRAGGQLIPLLNSGADGLRELADESDMLGNTISTKTAKAAEQFNDNISRLTIGMGGLGRVIAGPVIEAMADFTTSMFDAWKQGNTLFGMLEAGFKRLGQAGTIDQARAKVNELEAAMHKLMATPGFDPANMGAMNLAKNLDEARARLHELLTEQQKAAAGPATGGSAAPALTGADGDKKQSAFDLIEQLDLVDQKIKDQLSESETRYIESLEVRMEALRQSVLTEQQIAAEKHAKELEDLRIGYEEKLLTEQEFMLLEQDLQMKHMDEIARIRADGLKKVEDITKASWQAQAQTVAQQLQNMTAASANGSKAMFNINKAASIANALLSARESVTNAYRFGSRIGGPALGAAFAATAAAATAAQVRQLSSTSFNSGATAAGSVSAAGGSSVPSQLPAATLPNTAQASAASGQVVTIQLQGETFGREAVRNLISEINEAISDGAVLRLA
jgi:hypothetical protein